MPGGGTRRPPGCSIGWLPGFRGWRLAAGSAGSCAGCWPTCRGRTAGRSLSTLVTAIRSAVPARLGQLGHRRCPRRSARLRRRRSATPKSAPSSKAMSQWCSRGEAVGSARTPRPPPTSRGRRTPPPAPRGEVLALRWSDAADLLARPIVVLSFLGSRPATGAHPGTSAAMRKPILPALLSGVFALRAAHR